MRALPASVAPGIAARRGQPAAPLLSQTRPDAGGPTDEVRDLVDRAQSGDADAFGDLYDRYVPLIYRYIYYRVGSVAVAEDLTSETFLRALRRLASFTWQGRDLGAWLVTIARNSTPESDVLTNLTNETLLTAVKKLGPEQQECVVLRFWQGLSVNETALAMGKNDGAIKALQYRAMRSLARLLPEGAF